MSILVTACLLVGMVLGQRFKVLILVPASVVALVLVVGTGMIRADSLLTTALMAAAIVASLQVGYLGGIGRATFW